jgi:hypothetical protein
MNLIETTAAMQDSDYPATYRFGPLWRVFLAIFFGLLFFGAVAVEYRIICIQPIGTALLVLLVMGPLAALFVWLFAIVLTFRVTLASDAIETSTLWTSRRLQRDQIDGYRQRDRGSGGKFLELIPALSHARKIHLPVKFLQTDAAFFGWFSAFRDLDAADEENSLAAAMNNPEFGTTPQQRLNRLAVARKLAKALTALAWVLGVWSFVWPHPYWLAITTLAALPAIALLLVILSGGLFRIFAMTKIEVGVGMVFAFPAAVIAIRVMQDLDMVSEWPLIGASVAAAGVSVFATALIDRKAASRPVVLINGALIGGLYFFGLIGEANALLDRSPESIVRTQIMKKRVSEGQTTRYYFTLAPWGSQSEPDDARVTRNLYDSLQPGNMVCVAPHSGALGMPWFTVDECR